MTIPLIAEASDRLCLTEGFGLGEDVRGEDCCLPREFRPDGDAKPFQSEEVAFRQGRKRRRQEPRVGRRWLQ